MRGSRWQHEYCRHQHRREIPRRIRLLHFDLSPCVFDRIGRPRFAVLVSYALADVFLLDGLVGLPADEAVSAWRRITSREVTLCCLEPSLSNKGTHEFALPGSQHN